MTRLRVFAGAVAAAAGSVHAQTGTLDQNSPFLNSFFNISAESLTWQQQVRAGVAGQLEGISMTFRGDAGASVSVAVRLGSAWSASAPVFLTTFTKTSAAFSELAFLNMTSAHIQLNAGDTFVIELLGNGSAIDTVGSDPFLSGGPPYYTEPLFLNGSTYSSTARIGFRSYMLTGGSGCYANCDGSTTAPVLNVSDFTCFLQKFAASDPYANCDGSTIAPVLNVLDFTCFLQKFAAGCP